MSYKFSDSVSMRMIQIFQESVIFGIDGADLFRQVRLVVDENDPESLILDPEYEKQVAEMHQKYLEDLQKMKNLDETQGDGLPKLIFEN